MGAEKGKGGEPKGSKGKEIAKGKGHNDEWQQQKHSEDAESSYANQTDYEENWGLVKEQRKWGKGNYYGDWIQVGGKWRKTIIGEEEEENRMTAYAVSVRRTNGLEEKKEVNWRHEAVNAIYWDLGNIVTGRLGE